MENGLCRLYVVRLVSVRSGWFVVWLGFYARVRVWFGSLAANDFTIRPRRPSYRFVASRDLDCLFTGRDDIHSLVCWHFIRVLCSYVCMYVLRMCGG